MNKKCNDFLCFKKGNYFLVFSDVAKYSENNAITIYGLNLCNENAER